ncbi:hypothetical protein J2Z37_005115 [Ammoniphilus resinae]|uniref:Uncharacterized protein n=1 Tax=Ammoniphilus resinae TaxID=861532 RepID=A0ABS4GXS4_9BACL|nr:hypothetical protein [Ammoniphilus resinae]
MELFGGVAKGKADTGSLSIHCKLTGVSPLIETVPFTFQNEKTGSQDPLVLGVNQKSELRVLVK